MSFITRSRLICLTLVAFGALLLPSAVAAAKPKRPPEPRIAIPRTELEASFHCHGEVEGTKVEPVLFVTGTGATGEESYLIGKGAFDAFGHPVCDIDFPAYTTADIQVSVQYLVYAIRRESRMAGRSIAVIGISQGGLLPRFALTYWPSLRAKVTDVLAAAGTQHGTNLGSPARKRSPARPPSGSRPPARTC